MLEAPERRGGPLQRTPRGPFQFLPALCPKVVGSMPTLWSAGSSSGNLNLFPEPGSKSEETSKKQLSKDSILSLYGSQTPFRCPPKVEFTGVMAVCQPGNGGLPCRNYLLCQGQFLWGPWHHTPTSLSMTFLVKLLDYQEIDIVTQSHASVGSGLCEAWLGVWIWTLKGEVPGSAALASQRICLRNLSWKGQPASARLSICVHSFTNLCVCSLGKGVHGSCSDGAILMATQFPGAAPNSPMGSMMPPPVGMVAQPGASGMVAPMAMPAGYMGGMQALMMVLNEMMTTQQAGLHGRHGSYASDACMGFSQLSSCSGT